MALNRKLGLPTTLADLDFTMTAPKEMGGSGEGANPEQLFAAGYAACYHSALKAVAKDNGDSDDSDGQLVCPVTPAHEGIQPVLETITSV